ncbi:MAG: DUF2063 domain-containing protein, partial [Alphaproteobacteria bacterium]|nr:DUF2063 domain-containing protein [Alphaproteobacteria bacterium]
RALPPDRLENATATLHPSTHVIASKYPIVSIWRQHMSDEEMTPLDLNRGEEALVVRPELEIRVSTLPAGGVVFVDALKERQTFGEAVDAASGATAAFDLTVCLRELLLAEAFVAISVAH